MALAQGGPVGSKIDRELVGEPIHVGQCKLTPVARLVGGRGAAGGPQGGGRGAGIRLSPTKVLVQDSDGAEYELPIVDDSKEAMQGIAMGWLVIGVLGWLLVLLLKSKRRRAK